MIIEEPPHLGSMLEEAETVNAAAAQQNSAIENAGPLRHHQWRSIDGAAGRLLLSLVSGALLGAAFPKIGWGALAWVSLVPLLFVIDGRSLIEVFGYAWSTGSVFFV